MGKTTSPPKMKNNKNAPVAPVRTPEQQAAHLAGVAAAQARFKNSPADRAAMAVGAKPKTFSGMSAQDKKDSLASNESRYVSSNGKSGWKTPTSKANLKTKKQPIWGTPKKKGGFGIPGIPFSWGPGGSGIGGGTSAG